MTGEFLSQDEVDALLRGINGEEETPEEEEVVGDVRPYNLVKQERIVRGRMPTLEIIHDRFSRLLRVGLYNYIRRNPEISLTPVRVIKYSEFLRNLVVPTNLNVVSIRPLRGNALFIFEPNLVFAVVDTLFGGDGRFHTRIEGRDFSMTEQSIIQRMLKVILEDYSKAWSAIHPIKFEFQRAEMHTQFANIATPSEIVVASSFAIDLGGVGGHIHICFPYSSLEPIRDTLYSQVQGDQMEPDRRWLRMLSKQIQLADVDLVAKLTSVNLTVADLLQMKVGDIIPVDIEPTIPAEIDGIPVFECEVGVLNGQYALKIDEVITPSPIADHLGEKNHGN